MALIDKLGAIGDAIREKNGTTDLIPLADMPQAILDIISGGGASYTSITYKDNDTIELLDKDGITHTLIPTYDDDGALAAVSLDDEVIDLTYTDNTLTAIGNTVVDLVNAKVEEEGLPDWNDDSPIIASGIGATSYSVWELTEKGTMRWRRDFVNGSGSGQAAVAAGWNEGVYAIEQPEEYMSIASKIRQIDFEGNFWHIWLGYATNCERIRFIGNDLRTITLKSFHSLKEFTSSAPSAMSLVRFANNSLVEKITLPEGLYTLRTQYAYECVNLKEINLDSITTFGQQCFQNCANLCKDIVFNADLISIAGASFGYSGVKSITFQNPSDKLPTIANNAFVGCKYLEHIYCPWAEGAVENAPWGATNATIHYNWVEEENN